MAKRLRAMAIDPLALILRGDIYVKIHLPDPPPDEVLRGEVREAVAQMSATERKAALAHVELMGVYLNVMKRELNRQIAKG